MRAMTESNLKSAFSGESQAHMRYLIFGDIAQKEGKNNIARLFRGISYAEQIHATSHFQNLKHLKEGSVTVAMAGFGPRSTPDNLDIAIEGETYEIEDMYPSFKAIAEMQNERGALRSITFAYETEKMHQSLYNKAKKAADSGKDMELKNLYVCQVCGWTVEGDSAPEPCPLCKASKEMFKVF